MNKRMVFNKDYLNGKTKGHGITRKTKLGVASGIALAGGLAVSGNATMVSADEVTATLKPADTTPVATTTAETPTTATAPALEYAMVRLMHQPLLQKTQALQLTLKPHNQSLRLTM